MTTDPTTDRDPAPRRPGHSAAGARILALGASVAPTVTLMAAMSSHAEAGATVVGPTPPANTSAPAASPPRVGDSAASVTPAPSTPTSRPSPTPPLRRATGRALTSSHAS